MFSISLREVQLAMSIFLFVLAFITFGVGLIILISAAKNREIRNIATQTAKLAQKGIAEDVAGLVGNASALVGAMNNMVTTAAGIGLFLTILGVLMMIASFWLIFRIH